jgi:Family of unknown function (DUF6502)
MLSFNLNMPKKAAPQASTFHDPLKEATIAALKRVVDPLVDLMFDTGVTVHELSVLLRESAVRIGSKRVSKESGRESNSRVAIITGLPRAEVARILNSDQLALGTRPKQHPARKVLAAWFDNPRFLTTKGDPAVLPIFGKRRSFEQLVSMYGRGIPIRAMLDELTQINAVERLSDQRVKAKSRVPIVTGVSTGSISVIGERTRDLLDTLTSNLRCKSKPLFEGTALADDVDLEMVSLIRRELADQAASFIDSANSLLGRSNVKPVRPAGKESTNCRLGVTVFYFQDDLEDKRVPKTEAIPGRRKNLQRQTRRPLRERAINKGAGKVKKVGYE